MKVPDDQQLLTVLQLQKRLQIGKSKAYSLLATRSIPSIRIGRCLRIRKSDLDRYISDNRY
jgi:excisionase family DNA binding protein